MQESETIELKKSTNELKEGIISISSMLNKHNYGELYFGIKNDGLVVGQQISDKTLREISQAIANFIKPQIIPTISAELIDEKNVIKVVAEGSDVPYSAYGKYYMRSFDEDKELSPNQLKKLMNSITNEDEILIKESFKQDLSFKQFKSLLISKGLTVNDETFYSNFSLMNSSKKFNLMAELLSDSNNISIKVVTFRTKDKTEIVKRNEYGGKCLALAMDQVLSYVEAINDTFVHLTSHQRKEESLFDFPCFKEAWQNACIHNKRSKINPPAVYIFSNRIEIISTGGLPFDMTKEEFFKGISKPVNKTLQKIFGQLGYVEQTGHGIPLIINKYGEQAFEISDNFITVIIPFSKTNEVNTSSFKNELNQNQEKLFSFLQSKPESTIKDMSSYLYLSESYIKKLLEQLKEKELVERVGSNKKGYRRVSCI